ncbi:hypothetical protein [Streptomyces sp. 8P21H-1]|uniref:hypothetical protein n=1 Tax=Streptomyces sp. 8P21H-1 TaxID=2737048 RepID=UPI00156FF5F8|nr:hypothetical protein [Streptomyces sp. 8P21H-1]NSL42745.1 hypothetical protein [Streptomyces sp. 8P21H-1]
MRTPRCVTHASARPPTSGTGHNGAPHAGTGYTRATSPSPADCGTPSKEPNASSSSPPPSGATARSPRTSPPSTRPRKPAPGASCTPSHQAASATSLFRPQPVHAATEEHLRRLGVPCTTLRNGFYTATLEHYIGAALETGTLAVPQDGPFFWTAHEDLSEVAAAALADDADGTRDGVTPPLTAPRTLDFAGVAEVLGRLTGRTVSHVVVDDEKWIEAAVAAGMPRPAAEFSLTMFTAARDGEFDVTDPTLESVIGRPARTVEQILAPVVGIG